MLSRQEIIDLTNDRIAEVFEIEKDTILPQASIAEALELDSISLVDLISIIHVDFHIPVTPEELTDFKTFNDIYDYIETHQA